MKGNPCDNLIVTYFQDMFTTAEGTRVMDFLEPLRGWVTDTMNVELIRHSTKEEIFIALQ